MTLDVYEMCITTAGVIFVKSDYDVHDYIRCGFRQVPLRICQVRLHDASSTSTVDPVGVKFLSERVPRLPLRRVRLLPTTTIEQLLPLRPNTVDATSSSPDMYDYRCQDRKYLNRRRERLLPTTTRVQLLPLMNPNRSEMHASKV